jgi:hypothetical protein
MCVYVCVCVCMCASVLTSWQTHMQAPSSGRWSCPCGARSTTRAPRCSASWAAQQALHATGTAPGEDDGEGVHSSVSVARDREGGRGREARGYGWEGRRRQLPGGAAAGSRRPHSVRPLKTTRRRSGAAPERGGRQHTVCSSQPSARLPAISRVRASSIVQQRARKQPPLPCPRPGRPPAASLPKAALSHEPRIFAARGGRMLGAGAAATAFIRRRFAAPPPAVGPAARHGRSRRRSRPRERSRR